MTAAAEVCIGSKHSVPEVVDDAQLTGDIRSSHRTCHVIANEGI